MINIYVNQRKLINLSLKQKSAEIYVSFNSRKSSSEDVTRSKSRKVIMAGIDKVNDSEIKLILMPDDDSFIPMFWV